MPHTIEPAKTGRAKCRGCGQPIAAGALRIGERVPNPFADEEGAETTLWYHVACAALLRPTVFLEVAPSAPAPIEGEADLAREAALGVAHRRLPRATAVSRAASGRAVCRACKATIAKDAWRIALVFFEDGRFAPSGFIHLGCAPGYLETADVFGRLKHFSPALSDADWAEIRRWGKP
jgi:ribosomal protein L37AE/L43A